MANLKRSNTTAYRLGLVGLILLVAMAANYGYWIEQIRYYLGITEESDELSSVRLQPNELYIPSLGIRTPIIFTDKTDNKSHQEALKNGVVRYPGTAEIGEKGNPYIFGHSSNYPWVKSNHNTVFALLPKIELGSKIYATNSKGKVFTYYVQSTAVIKPSETTYLDQYDHKRRMLTLQTSYPIGTALKRFIVIAEMR